MRISFRLLKNVNALVTDITQKFPYFILCTIVCVIRKLVNFHRSTRTNEYAAISTACAWNLMLLHTNVNGKRH